MLGNDEKLKREEDFSTIYERILDTNTFSIDYFNHTCANIQNSFDHGDEEILLKSIEQCYKLFSQDGINYVNLVESLNKNDFVNFIINCIQNGFSKFSSSFSFLLLQILKIPPEYRIEIVSDDVTSSIINSLNIPNDNYQEQQEVYLLQSLQRAFCVDNYSTEFIEDAISRIDELFNACISIPKPNLINELLNVFSSILLIQTDHINETFSFFLLERCLQAFKFPEAKEGICYTLASILSSDQNMIEEIMKNTQIPDFLQSFSSTTDALLAFLGQVFRCENEENVDAFFEIIPWNIFSESLESNTEMSAKVALFIRDIIEYHPKYVSFLETNGIFSILVLCSKQSNYSISSACIDCIISAANYISTDCLSLMVEKGFVDALGILMNDDDEIDKYTPLLYRILHYATNTMGPNSIIVIQEYDDNKIDELIDECEEEEVEEIHEMAEMLRQYNEEHDND